MPFSRSTTRHVAQTNDAGHTMHGNQPHTGTHRTKPMETRRDGTRPYRASHTRAVSNKSDANPHTLTTALLNETRHAPGQTDARPRPESAPEPMQLPMNTTAHPAGNTRDTHRRTGPARRFRTRSNPDLRSSATNTPNPRAQRSNTPNQPARRGTQRTWWRRSGSNR
jgi:hypothetical protein